MFETDVNNDRCTDAEYSLIDLSSVCLGELLYLKLNLGTKDNPYIVTKKVRVTYTSVGQDTSLIDLSVDHDKQKNFKLMGSLPESYRFAFTECEMGGY